MEWGRKRFVVLFVFLVIVSFIFMMFVYDIPASIKHLLQVSDKRNVVTLDSIGSPFDDQNEHVLAKDIWDGGQLFGKLAISRKRFNGEKAKKKKRKGQKKKITYGEKVLTRGKYKSRLPNAIIIGSKKAGTRALLQHLKVNPEIRTCGKEVHFFDNYYDKGYNWYRVQMPPSFTDEITMEKTPAYFVTKSAPKRVKDMCEKFLLKTKFLVILRDPVERAISDYTQGLVRKKERNVKKNSFESKVFKKGKKKKEVNDGATIIKTGRYIEHLNEWLKYFDISRFYFVSAERFVSEPWTELEGVQKFLNVSVSITKDSFWYNNTKKFYCIQKTNGNGKARTMCLGNTKGRTHPKIDTETIHILQSYYKPFNDELYKKTGRNFGWPSS
ncbi:heparan sulfate glucosamine 3-O-sulfotransferase 6-like [Rhopilema esculentum]|uniref:heparan sulfate glucosamine 3-O-sulfotransferase 6-like n=1 Tax=Rhopilema esculentum TaxID=499914 RepID=UPI0031DFCA26|eukprot:gene9357-17060_t